MTPRKGWAAVYCRLSKEDEGKTTAESESIRNQRELLLTWAEEHGYRVYKVYTDEDYSGIDRARPEFNAMLVDAERGRFEAILAKTQSRFTRDMELVERYLHGLFPEWGVRFIAVLDHVDTCDPAGKKARQINGLINEWYLEDLSGNVRAVLDHKRHSGCYIASFALYGYRKDPRDHSRLLVDEPAAAVVRRIFALYLNGCGTAKIARQLNAEGIPPPSVYRALQGGTPGKPCLWSKATVRRILSTQTYAGDLEQGRVRKLSYKSKRMLRLPREEWIVVAGTHVPIIDRADFAAVQARLARRRQGADGGNTPHLLAGLVYCELCGGKMELTGSGERRYFRCRTAQKSRERCEGQKYLPMADIENVVENKMYKYTQRRISRPMVQRLIGKIVVHPQEENRRRMDIYWNF